MTADIEIFFTDGGGGTDVPGDDDDPFDEGDSDCDGDCDGVCGGDCGGDCDGEVAIILIIFFFFVHLFQTHVDKFLFKINLVGIQISLKLILIVRFLGTIQ